ncbi:hypothetical protein SAY86_023730 [Trapa natans]|uniref:Uncharacterized protein n=1 Tax=Trapa natans TaxID=22666 RepID=A0AAN7R9L0_TRANT|nr:hypothetical protein SAY86_023730 [Trapa natans]
MPKELELVVAHSSFLNRFWFTWFYCLVPLVAPFRIVGVHEWKMWNHTVFVKSPNILASSHSTEMACKVSGGASVWLKERWNAGEEKEYAPSASTFSSTPFYSFISFVQLCLRTTFIIKCKLTDSWDYCHIFI